MIEQLPDTLPNKPSALIRLALGDLKKAENTPGYEVDMTAWLWQTNGPCLVCFAGGVMAFSLNQKPICGDELCPSELGEKLGLKLCVLNDFRCGDIVHGLNRLGIKSNVKDRDIPNYEDYRDGFFAAMNELIIELEEEGN